MSKRRTFTPSFKAQVVLEVLAGGGAHDESEKRICELERMVGRLTMELEIARKSLIAVDLSAERKRELATMLATGEDYPVKRVCEVLGCLAAATTMSRKESMSKSFGRLLKRL